MKNWKPLSVVGGLLGISWFAGKKFEEAEFDIDMATYDMGPFKKNWQFEPKGNCLILASRR